MSLQPIDTRWILVCADFALAALLFWSFGFGFIFAGGFEQWSLACDYFR